MSGGGGLHVASIVRVCHLLEKISKEQKKVTMIAACLDPSKTKYLNQEEIKIANKEIIALSKEKNNDLIPKAKTNHKAKSFTIPILFSIKISFHHSHSSSKKSKPIFESL